MIAILWRDPHYQARILSFGAGIKMPPKNPGHSSHYLIIFVANKPFLTADLNPRFAPYRHRELPPCTEP